MQHVKTLRLRFVKVGFTVVSVVAALLGPQGPAHAAVGLAVTSLSITRGSTLGGTNLVINGTGFTAVDESQPANVKFGAVNATRFLVLSNTQIAVKAPAGTGTVDVRISDGTATSPIVTADKFTYREPITATVASGTLLNPLGRTVFLVTSSFNWGIMAAFANERVTATVAGASASVSYRDSTHLAVTAPVGTPSATPVAVMLIHDTVPGVADSTNTRFAAIVSSLNRTSGPLTGGATITVSGKGMAGATGWAFGTVAADCTNAASPYADSRATCTVPSSANGGTTAGAVTVRFTPAGGATYAATANAAYTYTDLADASSAR